MELTKFTRIEGAVDTNLLQDTHVVGVGAGGAYSLYSSLARCGIGKLTVFDFDEVEEVNVVRQGYTPEQIGNKKVDALADHIQAINSGVDVEAITENFLDMDVAELDGIFGQADLFLFLTDSFPAQAFGNKLALKYQKPALWGGYYARSRCSEIIFTIPGVTAACYRCVASHRYEVFEETPETTNLSSNLNTIFHSQMLDSFLGMLLMAILHNSTAGYEFSNWFGQRWDRNLIQFKVHPQHSNKEGDLFRRVFKPTGGRCFNFSGIWQQVDIEKPPAYDYTCPDCKGKGNLAAGNG